MYLLLWSRPRYRCITPYFAKSRWISKSKWFHPKNVDSLTPRVTRWLKWAGENQWHHATSLSLRVLQPMTDVDTRHRCCAAVVPLLCCCCYWPQHSPQHRNISIIDRLTIYSVKTDIDFVNALHKVLFPYSSITSCPEICLFLQHSKSLALDVSVNFTNLHHK